MNTPNTSVEGDLRARIAALEAKLAQWVPDWNGLVEGERDQIVNEICEYGTGFVTPLYAIVEGIERKLMERNAAPAAPEQQDPNQKEKNMDDPNMHAYGDHYAEITEAILRDVCELEPANPNLNDTLCVDVSDLKIIVDRALMNAQAPNAQQAEPIDPEVAAELERSDWTPEEALRWYAAGRHYDTVPNGDGTSSARILDNGAVASNALKSMSREYAEHKGDVALAQQAEAQPKAVPLTEAQAREIWRNGIDHGDDWQDALGLIRATESAHGVGTHKDPK